MNKNMNNELTQLKSKVAQLERDIQSLKRAGSIPVEIDLAFQGRGFIRTDKPETATAVQVADAGFRRSIDLSGGAEAIIVPAYPTKFVKIVNTNFYVPLHALDALY